MSEAEPAAKAAATVEPADRHATQQQFAAFFKREYKPLIRDVIYAGAELAEAQDAASIAMEDLYKRWRSVENPWAYVRTAAMRAFYKERTRGLKRTRDRQIERGDVVGREHIEGSPSIWENTAWVMEVLESLPPGQQAVMALVVDQFESPEIAKLLGATEVAVRQRLHAARQRLKATLRDDRSNAPASTAEGGPRP